MSEHVVMLLTMQDHNNSSVAESLWPIINNDLSYVTETWNSSTFGNPLPSTTHSTLSNIPQTYGKKPWAHPSSPPPFNIILYPSVQLLSPVSTPPVPTASPKPLKFSAFFNLSGRRNAPTSSQTIMPRPALAKTSIPSSRPSTLLTRARQTAAT